MQTSVAPVADKRHRLLAAAKADKRRRIVDLLLRSAYIALGFLKVDRTRSGLQSSWARRA